MKKLKKSNAFTLAETLITLMVIGVIAVMTIPTLKDHSDEVKYVTSLKKAYSVVSSATAAVEAKHTEAYFWNFMDAKTARWYTEVVNTIPNPDPDHATWKIIDINGTSDDSFTPTFWTADGMAWMFRDPGSGIPGSRGGWIVVDTNGAKQPNTRGIDIHAFLVGHTTGKPAAFGVYAAGDGCNAPNGDYACTAYAIANEKMPWFREPGQYTTCDAFALPAEGCPTFE